MAALQILLDRLNSGNIPINQSVWEQIQKGDTSPAGGSTTNITGGLGGKQVGGAVNNRYRRVTQGQRGGGGSTTNITGGLGGKQVGGAVNNRYRRVTQGPQGGGGGRVYHQHHRWSGW